MNGSIDSTGGGKQITLEEYRRQEKVLEQTCKQFEGAIFSKLWKDMIKNARNMFEQQEKKRYYGALEDTAMEMVSEHLSEEQGIGVWQVLYESLHKQLPLPEEIRAEQQAAMAAKRAAKEQNKVPLRDDLSISFRG